MMRKFSMLVVLICLIALAAQTTEMRSLDKGDLIVIEREVEGPTEQAAIDEVSREAVQSCVGRIYFSERLIMARKLLTRYIDNYYKKFIFSSVVDQKKHMGDKVRLKVKIFVNYSSLIKDLEEKEFLFKPRVRPQYLVFLKELLDEGPAPYDHGRQTVLSAWKDITGQRSPEGAITIPPTNLDILESAALKSEAIRVAEKKGAEIILSGTSISKRENRQELYYETYTFYRTTVDLKLIRADTGEILDETTVSEVAGSTMQSQAIQLSITQAARKAAHTLADYFLANWDKTVQGNCDYTFLFTGVNSEKLDIIKRHLASLDDESKVFVKSQYSDVAVVNLVYKGNREFLIDAIESLSFPRMHIIEEQENRFEIQIKN